jgi:protocatechuate 3,4-dioxygenase beta subunit
MATYPEYRSCPPRVLAGRALDSGEKLPPTPSDIEGPFYLPFQEDRCDIRDGVTENLLELSGRVLSTDGQPVDVALLEFWQAGLDGVYDEHGPRHRGNQVADANGPGTYRLHTFVPGDYKISEPGQPDEFRCAHIHVKVTAPGFKPLTTQLYFSGDPYNGSDRWFDPRRVLPASGKFDFVLESQYCKECGHLWSRHTPTCTNTVQTGDGVCGCAERP